MLAVGLAGWTGAARWPKLYMPAVFVPDGKGGGKACNLLPITGHKTLSNCRNLKVRPGDVFICSYPKSGTTWTQNIVYQLLSNGAELDHIAEYAPFYCADRNWDQKAKSPTLIPEVVAAQDRLGRRIFNTHLWWPLLPTAPQSAGTLDRETGAITPDLPGKFIYLVRNGKDVANSFYNHLSHMAVSDGGYEGSFAEFFADWVAGKIDFGSWPDHLESWLKPDASGNRPIDDPRVLVLTFEEMKADLPRCVQRIATHIECGLDAAVVTALLPKMDFKYMKENKEKFHPKSVAWREKGDGWEFVNKGTVGASKDTFGPAEHAAYDAMLAKAFPDGALAGLGIESRPDLVYAITGAGPGPPNEVGLDASADAQAPAPEL